MPAAETALRAWVNHQDYLVGQGQPLARGAFLSGAQPRSPSDGAYVLLALANAGASKPVCAEGHNPSISRVTGLVYAGTIEAAEDAATALSDAWHELRGNPEPCGDTGVTIMSADNFIDPAYVPQPAASGEQFCFLVSAEFLLMT
jgi:hypothetical protein